MSCENGSLRSYDIPRFSIAVADRISNLEGIVGLVFPIIIERLIDSSLRACLGPDHHLSVR